MVLKTITISWKKQKCMPEDKAQNMHMNRILWTQNQGVFITQLERGYKGRFLSRFYLMSLFELRHALVRECWAEHDNQREQYEQMNRGEKQH